MRENFERCMDIVARWEGGYVDHPRDPGGATNMGITINTLRSWRGTPVTKEDVKNLTREEAHKIFFAWYWMPVRGDDLPPGVDLVAFDAAVNSGPSRGAKWLQSALAVKADGFVGLHTIEAARKADPTEVIIDATQVRLNFLKGLSTWDAFGKGWTNRVLDIRKEALAMTARPVVKPVPKPDAKLSGLLALILSLFARRK